MRDAARIGVLAVIVLLAGCTSLFGAERTDSGDRVGADQQRLQLPVGREAVQFTWVNISADRVQPTRAVAENGTTVGWRNTNTFSVYIDFPWMSHNFSIPAGGQRTLLLQGETTYRVYHNDTQELVAEGSVRVG